MFRPIGAANTVVCETKIVEQLQMDPKTRVLVVIGTQLVSEQIRLGLIMLSYLLCLAQCSSSNSNKRRRTYTMLDKIPKQVDHMSDLVKGTDNDCINNLRMDRNTFARLCYLLKNYAGLKDEKWVSVEEQTTLFLHTLAHHAKNTVVKFDFKRSGSTISKYFNRTLDAILTLHDRLLATPNPVAEGCRNDKFKLFKGCLGALDGTYIEVQVPQVDNVRYRTRKSKVCTNVLGACDMNMKFTYILAGWEGSAADSRVLRDALTRPNGLHVPDGTYYLCDNGYSNAEGFLTPYRGIRYHLDEWGPRNRRPQNYQEYFNMKHCKARNIIELAFGHLKNRWAVLRSNMFYPVKTQTKIIMACALLHNFIRSEMAVDPLDLLDYQIPNEVEHDMEYIDTVETSPQWSNWRDEFAQEMYNNWRYNA